MQQLIDKPVDIKLKLSGLWVSTLFCFIYCDYFELYTTGKLEGMIAGDLGPLGQVSQGVLLGMSTVIIVPCLMVALTIMLKAGISRILNIIVSLAFVIMMAFLTYEAGWYFYKMYAAVETMLVATIAWQAWNWPKQDVM